ncbi:ArsR/SmtB family transcription factor [Streptomyces zingiberis]|uniref:Helix-turn-helix transcriptional regulator n=1 Tax=Streptomyces zingiberis TaxID=2053010 RepID=A0ABX1CAB1_9ACTN|nr:metalloregulator ArsR/SmtB family transcription factor [Streptomyces zingiberis]NJQ03859.1 helix-turn-helix transcriptional regulator [Streptomyces zingiberis]
MTDDRHDRHDGPDRRTLDPERDSEALKALTHPLRIRLLGALRQDGPATATELARATAQSSASTSYHLRVLARHGFVAEATHRDGRERRWRAEHTVTAWSNEAMRASPAHRAFLDVARRAQIEHLERSIARHEADLGAGRLAAGWQEPSGIDDRVVRLTPASLTELWEVFTRTADELAARDAGAADAEQVVLVTAGLPVARRDRDRTVEGADGADAADTGTDASRRDGADGPRTPERGSWPGAATGTDGGGGTDDTDGADGADVRNGSDGTARPGGRP